MVAEEVADGVGFKRVADRRRSAVGVHVTDVGGLNFRVAYGVLHYAEATFVFGRRLRDVVRVAGHPISHDLGNRLRSAGTGMIEFFKHQNSGAFADHETITITVPWTAGFFRIIVAG